jgi:hypothetical protein
MGRGARGGQRLLDALGRGRLPGGQRQDAAVLRALVAQQRVSWRVSMPAMATAPSAFRYSGRLAGAEVAGAAAGRA